MSSITMYAYFVALVLFLVGWFVTGDVASRNTRMFWRAGLVALYVMPAITLSPANRILLPAILAFFVDLFDTGFTFSHPAWIAFWWLFAFAYSTRRSSQRQPPIRRR